MILSNTISLNTSIKKTGKSDNKIMKYTLDNISLNFSASQSRSSDVTYSEKWSETYSGKFAYNLSFGRNNFDHEQKKNLIDCLDKVVTEIEKRLR